MAKNGKYVSVSEITSYAYCPRLCYFRQRFGEEPNVLNAAKEIYLSLRRGLDFEWAKNKFISLGGSLEFFERAKTEFAPLDALQKYKPIEWEVSFYSEKYRLKGVVDEIVNDSRIRPLALSLKSPRGGVWFKDAIKIASYQILLNESGFVAEKVESGLVYHCFDGVLREVEINRKLRLHVIKLIERVLRVRGGFIPDRREGKRCLNCSYFQDCKVTGSTFASKFL
jgi:CRISPR-associated exonuclease Cas4